MSKKAKTKPKPTTAPSPPPHKWEHLFTEFKATVYDRADEVDPGEEMHWGWLAVGWALAKGLSPEDANEFATIARYERGIA